MLINTARNFENEQINKHGKDNIRNIIGESTILFLLHFYGYSCQKKKKIQLKNENYTCWNIVCLSLNDIIYMLHSKYLAKFNIYDTNIVGM